MVGAGTERAPRPAPSPRMDDLARAGAGLCLAGGARRLRLPRPGGPRPSAAFTDRHLQCDLRSQRSSVRAACDVCSELGGGPCPPAPRQAVTATHA